MSSAKLEKIQRGNTSPGVNREIIEYLLSLNGDFADKNFLDVPCGNGAFLQAVNDFFPKSKNSHAQNLPNERTDFLLYFC